MTALEAAGLDYETRPIDLLSGAQKGSEYLAVNRKGKVPALLADGKLLTENAAILHFLDRRFPDAALFPHSDDPVDDNRGLADAIWCSSTLHPMVRQIRNPQRFTKGETAGVKLDGQEKFAVECGYMQSRLAAEDWWYGSRWSIIDTYLYWAYSTASKGGDFPLGDYPALARHSARVRQQAAFQSALAREIAAASSENLGVDPASL